MPSLFKLKKTHKQMANYLYSAADYIPFQPESYEVTDNLTNTPVEVFEVISQSWDSVTTWGSLVIGLENAPTKEGQYSIIVWDKEKTTSATLSFAFLGTGNPTPDAVSGTYYDASMEFSNIYSMYKKMAELLLFVEMSKQNLSNLVQFDGLFENRIVSKDDYYSNVLGQGEMLISNLLGSKETFAKVRESNAALADKAYTELQLVLGKYTNISPETQEAIGKFKNLYSTFNSNVKTLTDEKGEGSKLDTKELVEKYGVGKGIWAAAVDEKGWNKVVEVPKDAMKKIG
jgi:hypothetical protein